MKRVVYIVGLWACLALLAAGDPHKTRDSPSKASYDERSAHDGTSKALRQLTRERGGPDRAQKARSDKPKSRRQLTHEDDGREHDIVRCPAGVKEAMHSAARERHLGEHSLRNLNIVGGLAAKLTKEDRDYFVALGCAVETDNSVRAFTTIPWNLDRIDQASLPVDNQYNAPYDGSGVDIFVIDSGVDPDHTEFAGRIGNGTNILGDQDSLDTSDCFGHGTHVAGTAAGTLYGVAKGATIRPVRVLDCEGFGEDSYVIAGIEFAVLDSAPRKVIVMSLGGSYSESLNLAVQAAHDAGVTVVVAAGIEQLDACFTSPASAAAAITVGASDRDDTLALFSNFGPCVDIAAPGVDIESADFGTTSGSSVLSGTSMAAPAVAGVAAQMIQQHGSSSPSFVWSMIKGQATPAVLTSPFFASGDPMFPTNTRLLRSASTPGAGAASLDDDYSFSHALTSGPNLVQVAINTDVYSAFQNTLVIYKRDSAGGWTPVVNSLLVSFTTASSLSQMHSTQLISFYLEAGTYLFAFTDNFGDGVSDDGTDSYHIAVRGEHVATGKINGYAEVVTLDVADCPDHCTGGSAPPARRRLLFGSFSEDNEPGGGASTICPQGC